MMMDFSRARALGALAAAAVAAVALASCNDHSLSLDITPNPIVVGLLDRQATVHAHAVARGFGRIPFTSVQFVAFSGADQQLASQTEKVDQSIPASPLGYVVDKDFTIPINGIAVALSGTRYVTVRILDPSGNTLSEKRVDVVVHALKDLPVPSVLQAGTPTPH